MKKILVACATTLMLAGCSSPDGEQTAAVTSTETVTEAPAATVTLPEGYPQIVPISEIPDNMQGPFEGTGTGEAVAVAPGVWAELTPGATADDAVNAGIFSGYCSSKEAFEREYLNGKPTAGTCW